MSRVKRGVTAHARHKAVLKQAKGYYGRRKNTIRIARQAVEKAGAIRLSRPAHEEAQFPRALDSAHQRCRPRAWADLRPVHRRPQQGRHRGRPQGAVGPGHHRSGRLRGAGWQGPRCAAGGAADCMRLTELTVPELLSLANILLRIAEEIPVEDRDATRQARDEIAYILRLISEKEGAIQQPSSALLH